MITDERARIQALERENEDPCRAMKFCARYRCISLRRSSIVTELVLVTSTGDFSLDAISGGVAAIIDLAWQIFMFSPSEKAFVVTLDEPENHLHPELQQSILPSFLNAFPNVQFIVASHSPFVVSSTPDFNVYALRYDTHDPKTRRVYSTLLDTINKAGTSNEILRDVLGMSYTMPIWVAGKIDSVISKYESNELTPETLTALRAEMKGLGLDRFTPETIARVVEGAKDQ